MTWNTTLVLVAAPLVFMGAYLLTCRVSNLASGEGGSTGETARAYIPSLIPIALAYNVAHFFSFLAIQGQLIVKEISDPLGWGWDLFGTADWQVQISIVSARLVWFVGVGAIVIGHVIAVYVAHVISYEEDEFRGGDKEPVPNGRVDGRLHGDEPLDRGSAHHCRVRGTAP